MMPPESEPNHFIGSMVSIDCGLLGTYQGRVKMIDTVMNTLTITHAYHNGLQCDQSEVNLCSTTIRNIKIIHASHEAKEIISRKATPSKMTKEIDEVTKPVCSSPIKIIEATSKARNGNGHFHSGSNGHSSHNKNSCRRKLSPPDSPSKLSDFHDGSLGPRPRMSRSREPPIQEASEQNVDIDEAGSSGGSGSFQNWCDQNKYVDPGRKGVHTKKVERYRRGANAKNTECFSAPTESYLQEEFDFESNLAKFNKKKVFQEIENGFPDLSLEGDPSEQKYRHDENILQSGDTVLRKQIQIPERKTQMYFTDNGMAVPSISLELRDKLTETASIYGLTHARQRESFGRAASDMVIHLIGGGHRIHPKNNHQIPSVVVLCGPHEHGALGVCCARILSSHGVQVTLFMPSVSFLPPVVSDEQEMYKLTESTIACNVKDLPKTIDLIVTALDTPYDQSLTKQNWYVSVTKWLTSSDIRAQVLALDPPAAGPGIPAKWSLCKVLPLTNLASTCGSLYLCDLSIPSSIYTKCGITYVSPFGPKFVIPLHAQR